MKSIEIYYDIAEIPDIQNRGPFSTEALDFRNRAMHVIETALSNACAGEWVGAEIGETEVNFGFDVDDFDLAEKTVRDAVAGTPYAAIRTIERHEFSEEELMEMAAQAPDMRPMTIMEILWMTVFRRMPKRFIQ